jgi:predicted component of type VI protein secretion system
MDPNTLLHTEASNFGLRVIVYNEVDGQTTDLLFNQFPIRVGRNPMNDLVLSHQYVSQWHAVIGLEGQKMTVTQVGSSNSVQVGEQRLRQNEELPLTGQEAIRIVPFLLHVQPVALPSELRKPPALEHSVIAQEGIESEQVMLERTALKMLDRLSTRFLGQALQTPKEIASFASRLESALGVFLRFFVALQKGQEQFRQALDIKALGREGRNPIEEVGDANELAALLLSAEGATAITFLEHAFKNIMLHQVALINGLMAGVRSLLARLSPKAILKEASTEHRSPNVKVLWETYEQIHRDLAEEDNETFETIFGQQFGKAYANLVGKKAQKKR